MAGFPDESHKQIAGDVKFAHRERPCKSHLVPGEFATVEREIRRDTMTVFVRPELVVEIAFNDIQASTQYSGGLALRFARVKRYRTDKSAAAADTFQAVQKLAGLK